MTTPRTRDDFQVWAMAEADITRRRLGLDQTAINWQAVVELARAAQSRGGSEVEFDWERIVTQAATRPRLITVVLRKLTGRALELVECLGAGFDPPRWQKVQYGLVGPLAAAPEGQKPAPGESDALVLPAHAGRADIEISARFAGPGQFQVTLTFTRPGGRLGLSGVEVRGLAGGGPQQTSTTGQDGVAVFTIGPGAHEFECRLAGEADSLMLHLTLAEIGGPRRWRFERRAEECIWKAGDPSAAAGRVATVEAEWQDVGQLHVAVAGFLKLGRGYTVQASWLASDETVRAASGVDERIELVRLESPDRLGPRPGDRLRILHSWRPQKGTGWEVELTVDL